MGLSPLEMKFAFHTSDFWQKFRSAMADESRGLENATGKTLYCTCSNRH